MYGAPLWWFLRHRWISPVIWVLCLAGTIVLFMLVPKSFLPPGDSSVIFGAFMAREGSSPKQMREYQTRVDEVLQNDPHVITEFTMTDHGVHGCNRDHFTYHTDQDATYREVTAEVGKTNTIPGSGLPESVSRFGAHTGVQVKPGNMRSCFGANRSRLRGGSEVMGK